MSKKPWTIIAVVGLFLFATVSGYYYANALDIKGDKLKSIKSDMEKIRPLHSKLGKPEPGDWLAHHKEEGQTFKEYLECDPTLPTKQRGTIYIQPLGDFTKTQRKIVNLSADFLQLYFNLPVKINEDLPLNLIPKKARRINEFTGKEQILSTYVLDDLLLPRLPKDASAFIAFTASDLWPGKGWNFVFGQASIAERVGVWSINRFGDPDKNDESFRTCLLHTLKTASHETGHMFSILHCTAYECNMCGSNSLDESARRTLAPCPECVAKIWVFANVDHATYFQKLADFCKTQKLAKEEEFFLKCVKNLTPVNATPKPAITTTPAPKPSPTPKSLSTKKG